MIHLLMYSVSEKVKKTRKGRRDTGDVLYNESRLIATYQMALVDADLPRQVAALQNLGDYHLMKANERWYTGVLKATALYNAAILRSTKEEQTKVLNDRLREVEKCILGLVRGLPKEPKDNEEHDDEDDEVNHVIFSKLPRKTPEEYAKKHQESLQKTRDHAREHVMRAYQMWSDMGVEQDAADIIRNQEEPLKKELMAVRKRIKQDFVKLLQSMSKEALHCLGRSPCKFSLMATGSLASEDCTPFGDLELILALEDEDLGKQTIDYFHRYASLVNFRLLNIGETPLTCTNAKVLNDVYNHEMPALFDGACASGVKCVDLSALSQQPDLKYSQDRNPSAITMGGFKDLARAAQSCAMQNELYVVLKCLQTTHIDGDSEIHVKFKEELEGGFFLKPERRLQLCSLVSKDFDILHLFELNPEFYPNSSDLHLTALVNDLASVPRFIFLLKVVYGIQANTSVKILDELRSRLVISSEVEHDLKMAVLLAHFLLCAPQLRYQNQVPVLNALEQVDGCAEDEMKLNIEVTQQITSQPDHPMMVRIYSAIAPSLTHLRKIYTMPKKPGFGGVDTFTEHPLYQALAFHRVLRYRDAVICLKRVLIDFEEDGLETVSKAEEFCHHCLNIGIIGLQMKDLKLARTYFTKAMDTKDKIQDSNMRAKVFALAWISLGMVLYESSEPHRGMEHFVEAMDMFHDMTQGTFLESEDADILCLNLRMHQGMALVHETLCNEKEWLDSLQTHLDIQTRLYPEKTATSLRICILQSAGQCCLNNADYKTAHFYFKQALACCNFLCLPNQPSIPMASILHGLGVSSEGLGKAGTGKVYKATARLVAERSLGTDIHRETLQRVSVQGGYVADVLEGLRVLEKSLDSNFTKQLTWKDELMDMLLSAHSALSNDDTSLFEYIRLRIKNADSLIRRKHPDQAIEILENSLDKYSSLYKSNMHNARVYACKRLLAVVAAHTGRVEEALRDLVSLQTDIKTQGGENNSMLLQLDIQFDKVDIYCKQQDYDKAMDSLQHCLTIQRQLYGAVHPDIADTYRYIGRLQSIICDIEGATGSYTQALDMYFRLYGENTPTAEAAEVYLDLARTYQRSDRLPVAERHFVKALNIQNSVYGEGIPNKGTCEAMVALADHYRLVGRNEHAVQKHKEAIRMALQLTSCPAMCLADLVSKVGEDYQQACRYTDAVDYYNMALKIVSDQQGTGNNAPSKTAAWLRRLGQVHDALGELDLALEYQEKALALRNSLEEEEEDSNATASLSMLARHFEQNAQFTRAIPLRKKALTQATRLYGNNKPHPDVLDNLTNLVNDLLEVGNYSLASEYNGQLTPLLNKQRLGSLSRAALATNLHVSGKICQGLSRFEKAEECYKSALSMFTKLSKPGIEQDEEEYHGHVISCLTDLAKCMLSTGQLPQAIEQLERALVECELYQKNKTHQDVLASVYMTLGWAYETHPNFATSLQHYQKALDVLKVISKEEDKYREQYGRCLVAMGRAHCANKNPRRGVAFLQKSRNVFAALFGEDCIREETIEVNFELGKAHSNVQNTQEAINCFKTVLNMARQKYGVEKPHLQIAKYLGYLAAAFVECELYEDAITHAQQAIGIYHKVLKQQTTHPDVAGMTSLIGDCHFALLRYDDALRCYKDASLMHLNLNNFNAFSADVEKSMKKVRLTKDMLAQSS